MYNQRYIDSRGEIFFDRIIANGKTPDENMKYQFNIERNSFDQVHIYHAFHHYLVKKILTEQDIRRYIPYLKKIYDVDFKKYPHLFARSPLLSGNVLNKVIRVASDYPNELIALRQSYYFDPLKWKNLCEKSRTNTLTPTEKNQYFAMLIRIITNPIMSDDEKKIVDEEIDKIINSNKKVKDFDNIELQFYCQYVSRFVMEKNGCGNDEYKNLVLIGENHSESGGYFSNGVILINKNSSLTEDIPELTEVVCHETIHSIQSIEVRQGKLTNTSFERSYFELFRKYLSTKAYDSYHTNYRSMGIELEAEDRGFLDAKSFFWRRKRNDLADEVSEFERMRKNRSRHNYSYMITASGIPRSLDTFIVENMDFILKRNPSELKNYPFLQKIYNVDGSRKDLNAIFEMRDSENRRILEHCIGYEAYRGNLSSLKLDELPNEIAGDRLNSLMYVFNSWASDLERYFNTTEYDGYLGNQKLVELSTIHQIRLLKETILYVTSHYDRLLSINANKYNVNSIPGGHIQHLERRLKNFNKREIANEQIRNNPTIMKELDGLQETYDKFMEKYNRAFLKEVIKEELTFEERTRIVHLADGKDYSLDKLLLDRLPKLMNYHKELVLDGKKHDIVAVVKAFKTNLSYLYEANKEIRVNNIK